MPDPVIRFLERLPLWAWGLPVALFLALGVRTGLRLARGVLARRPARSRRIGEAGARRAIAMLLRERWTVLATEVMREGVVEVDGRLESFVVRADALVSRRGEVWVAEVKGGDDSSSVHDRATRRQLLEYAHVFGAEGVLLVDAHRGRIHVVRFPTAAAPARSVAM
jgi:hypothetical protein